MSLYLQLANTELNLELVQVLFRHGERTPREKELSPNDLSNVSIYEPWGLAQLTNEGKMREYRIGKMLRDRYNKFLGDIYYPSDVYAFSSDHDRTKMSLQLVLAALYHPAPTQKWNENLSWIPIPTYYMPEKVDDLMKPDLSPLYINAIKEVRNTEEILKRVSPYKDLFDLLFEKTGKNVTATNESYEMYNQLAAKKAMNLPLPEWCTDEVYKKLQDTVKIEYDIRSYTPFLKRLNGGALIKRFIDNIKINEKRDRPRKIYLYSGHEVNIAAVAKALNLPEPELPPYGCAIILEKLRDSAGKSYIRMLYWSGATEELKVYKIPGNEEICPMEKYLDIVKDVLPTNEEVYHKWDHLSKEDLRQLYEERLNLN
ncbi:PREDICTED: venom acid phosphatase Acph-1-like isoform X3 [Eufriesea mexicana]|uniref:venom acid phosphatase Acph-1-like isoform X2 n=1 Tax=Eufriesea mexicana TaxID=516756 RepID=UPI00083C4A9C|nr:PREDICTED: venom acid phosphatase Acph-1-like isoform X2 [Eufriesea mexicana]XP_017766881.1 PREDICTED: venom acid phosphatase Acph-1-like isoform X3 [Eufriesea mexicana]